MKILFHVPQGSGMEDWMAQFVAALPEAQCRTWQSDDNAHADYILAWRPPVEMLHGRENVKAIFNLGAGVDAILQLGDALPANVPLIRIDDGGMAIVMAEYVTHTVLGYFRQFDIYQQQAARHEWKQLSPPKKKDFSVGILGLGVLGTRIAEALHHFEFPLNGWSRTLKNVAHVQSYAGDDQLDAFLSASRILVCILPLTAATRGIVNRANLQKLPHGAYVINVARGAHVVEEDLLALIQEGHIAGATLDVFGKEPLLSQHPFWQEPRITITPHVSAQSVDEHTVQQITDKIRALERGETVSGVVDRAQGY